MTTNKDQAFSSKCYSRPGVFSYRACVGMNVSLDEVRGFANRFVRFRIYIRDVVLVQ
jgi:hypothetical protein